MPKIIFEHIFYCKNVSKEKFKSVIFFYLKCTKPIKNCILCIADRQTLRNFPQINLIVIGLTPLHMQMHIQIILLHNNFISEPIFISSGTFSEF